MLCILPLGSQPRTRGCGTRCGLDPAAQEWTGSASSCLPSQQLLAAVAAVRCMALMSMCGAGHEPLLLEDVLVERFGINPLPCFRQAGALLAESQRTPPCCWRMLHASASRSAHELTSPLQALLLPVQVLMLPMRAGFVPITGPSAVT